MNPASGNIRTGNSVTFTDVPAGGTPTNWNWSFGDGTPTVNITTNAAQFHSYSAAGPYTATLTVSNLGGSTTRTSTVNVYDLPTADFSASPNPVGTGATVTFTSSTTGSGLTYAWNFGSGATPATSIAANPTCSYSTTGTKTVSLTVSDPVGSIPAVTHTVSVNQGPTAAFTPNVTAINTNGAVLFTDQSTNSPQAWNWSFGDGSSWVNGTASSNPVHPYTANGTYVVTLLVNNTIGSSSATATINVYDPPTGVSITANPTTLLSGNTVVFNGTYSGFVNSWDWNFGDGSPHATTRNTTHVYTATSNTVYLATYTVSNPAASGSNTQDITVTIPTLPVPVITSDVTTGNVPLVVTFSSSSSNVVEPNRILLGIW